LAGCGDDPDTADGARSTSTVAPSPDSTVPVTEAPPSTEVVPVCQLLNPETVGAVLGEQVTPEPDAAGGCSYQGPTATSRRPFIAVVAADGDSSATREAAEQRLGGTASMLQLADGTGWMVAGSKGGTPGVEAEATAKGSTISLTMGSTDPAADRLVVRELLDHVIDALG
jgi:hypothetical protein